MKTLFTAFVCLLCASSAFGQSAMKWTMNDTTGTFVTGTDFQLTGKLQNTTDSTLSLSFYRWQLLPSGWTTSVCFGSNCYAPFIDTTQEDFMPHESKDFILHVDAPAKTNGIFNVTIRLRALTGNDADTAEMTFIGKGTRTFGVVASSTAQSGLSIGSVSPNPIVGQSAVNVAYSHSSAGSVSFKMIDLLGHSTLLGQSANGTESVQLAIPNLAAGFYMLVATTESGESATYPMQVLAH